ncbi:hypothetical protein M2152_001493 [Microbacteriaceae bacterium SG_E_30_P1]|uniref:DUF2076 domain-containing protein n=1 Tax=Antiquaquibacter oligotrophicus TaxID=2880260 RepID=A0ABT6KMS7_9MICO|nr:hypothetical protein [Antiquaquibacter oligotrophicus]MDH6181311.1 hypothetical protein [Antiquaquibacter oligotrophicus]UDF12996.1 hypothetical protein LH407_12650 [Antiquaquibacter oligotrophicus]
MGFLDRLFGAEPAEQTPPPRRQRNDDEIAVERYRYLLRTAPPETIEHVHTEAFAKLTDAQRSMIFDELTANAPAGEAPRGNDARSLAQSATRSELRQPGTMERSFQGPSFGSMVGSSLLGTIAGYVIGSAIVGAFLPPADASADAGADTGAESADAGGAGDSGDGLGDFGGADFGGDFGGDFGF